MGAILEFLIQGPYIAGGQRGIGTRYLAETLRSTYGVIHIARLVLLGITALLLMLAWRDRRAKSPYAYAVWPLGISLAVTFAAIGHARTTSPAWFSIPMDTAHVIAMAAWVGGLVIVVAALLPSREPGQITDALGVFSRTAFTAVAVLAVTGSYAALRGVGSWAALERTEYGLLVIVKIVLFIGLIALGNVSRGIVRRRLGRPVVAYAMSSTATAATPPRDDKDPDVAPSRDLERLRRSVLVEIALAAVVLAATSVLVGDPRGREAHWRLSPADP